MRTQTQLCRSLSGPVSYPLSMDPSILCDLDQVLLKEVMPKNRGLTLSDLKERSPEHSYLPRLQGMNLLMAFWNLQM